MQLDILAVQLDVLDEVHAPGLPLPEHRALGEADPCPWGRTSSDSVGDERKGVEVIEAANGLFGAMVNDANGLFGAKGVEVIEAANGLGSITKRQLQQRGAGEGCASERILLTL